MSTYRCASCGREIAPAPNCPHCGAVQVQWIEELARVERSIADMKARDAALLREQKQIAAKMQAALFQRDILAHASDERLRRATKPRRVIRRRLGRRPPTAEPGPPPRIPRQPPFRGSDGPPPPPPVTETDVADSNDSAPRPETSSREVQNVLLGLGALLLGVAAVVFAAVAISSLDTLSRVAILIAATGLMLVAPPLVARRGLSSTAETIAAVGLLLVPLDGYALWTLDQVRAGPLSGAVFAGLTLTVTAAIAAGYAGPTGLSVPRYATVLALQPILPLLAYDWITSAAGWAVVLTAVAAADLYIGHLLAQQQGRLSLPPWLSASAGGAPEIPTDPAPPGGDRPETAPEEADEVLRAEPAPEDPIGPSQAPGSAGSRDGTDDAAAGASAPSAVWLREVAWILHGLAIGVALFYAVVALVDAVTVPTATRAGCTLLLAAAVGLAGALTVRQPPLPDVAAGVMTLAVIGAAGRVAAVALPGRAMLLIAAVIAVTGLGVRAVPASARRGPQLASAVALIVIGTVVAGSAVRAALAPVRAALPAWEADLSAYADKLDAAVGPADWQLAAAAFLLTIAAVLSLPHDVRREFAVAGAALTALAAPASFGLAWWAAPWPPTLTAIGIGLVGLSSTSERAARAHVIAAGVVGVAGAGAAVARPGLTAAVLLVLAGSGALIALVATIGPARNPYTGIIGDWAAGGAAFALPGAVAAFVATTAAGHAPTPGALRAATVPVLAATFLAVCATLGYAALTLVAQRRISTPLSLGTGLGALAATAAAFGARGATVADAWVGALLLVSGVLLFLAPSIDAGRRADRLLDGPDFAAAAATAALVATLARIAAILAPGAQLAAAAGLVLVVALGIRATPEDWRRGPALGVAASGGVIALIAGYAAGEGGLRALTAPGPLWGADLTLWSDATSGGSAWQAPVALVLLAVAAALALPRPWAYDIAAICVGLATIGAPAALGLPWWSPIIVGTGVATSYGVAAVAAADPRAGLARAAVAAAVALHAVGASLARPWTTAVALGLVALIGFVVAALARVVTTLPPARTVDDSGPGASIEADDMPAHLAQIGGTAVGGALLALPGALASLAATLHWPADVVLTSALAGSTLGVAVVALVRRHMAHYLSYATVGLAGGATVTAVASLPTHLPTGVYAAAAVLLGVLAELVRAATPLPGAATEPVRQWSVKLGGAIPRLPRAAPRGGWSVSPVAGAMTAAALPTALAVAAIAPALVVALVDPFQTLRQIWQGPPTVLTTPSAAAIDGTNVLAALLLTIAAALAATGFNSGTPARAVPVILPGAAITLLIAPISLGMGWPNSTMAALAVFTISVLGLALTQPPRDVERDRPLRVARIVVFGIGLAAGGAGLAGSLATEDLTLFTLGSAVGVGAVAAVFGRTQTARILGWLFAAIMAQAFVLTAGLVAGVAPMWSAFGVLAVGAALLLVAATLPRLRRPEAFAEAATVEWTGYAAALIALALAYDSLRHIAALLAAWGAVLSVAAIRRGRRVAERRALFWSAVVCEIVAWWLLMSIANVALPEAYTLPFAALSLLVGLLELRQRADLSSWVAYGPALVAALLPTLVIVVATDTSGLRQVLLLLGAVATLIFGSMRQQQAPVVIGGVATALTALHALTLVGPWLVLIPVGITLLALGASNERRRRTQERLRVVREMR